MKFIYQNSINNWNLTIEAETRQEAQKTLEGLIAETPILTKVEWTLKK